MSRLLRAEIRRLLSRRFTLVALLVVGVLLALFQVGVGFAVRPPDPANQAQSRASYEQEVRDWEKNHEQNEQECLASGASPENCTWPPPTEADYGLAPVAFADIGTGAVQLAVYLTALALFFLAASFVAAEYTTGSLANWLTFVPRRGAVYASKLLIVVGFAAGVTALAIAVTLGVAALLTTAFGGDLQGLSALVAKGGRGVAIGVIFAVVGFCVGLLTRHTAAAIGVLLGYLFVWFARSIVRSFWAWPSRLPPWTPESNLDAILNHGSRYQVFVGSMLSEQGPQVFERTISLGHGVAYWAVILAVLAIGSLLVFRRRDVT